MIGFSVLLSVVIILGVVATPGPEKVWVKVRR